MAAIGKKIWVIAEGYIPPDNGEATHQLVSHETACMLNSGNVAAHVKIMIYFHDREPLGPYNMVIPPRRTYHMRFNDLTHPASVPRDTDYSSVIESDQPIVVQHTRLDSRQPNLALLSTIAFPVA